MCSQIPELSEQVLSLHSKYMLTVLLESMLSHVMYQVTTAIEIFQKVEYLGSLHLEYSIFTGVQRYEGAGK